MAAIVESAADAIISKNLEGVILSWNAGAERLYGYTAAEAVGKPVRLLLPADGAGEEDKMLAGISRGERLNHFESVRQTKNGERIEVSLSVSPICDGNGRIVGASEIAREAAVRRGSEEESGRLDAIVQSSEDAVISKTLDGTILTWNKGAERIYGYTAAEAVGQPMTLVLPEDRGEEETAILERVRLRQEVQHFETTRRRKDGELIDVSL